MDDLIKCGHCGKPVLRDPVLFRVVPHESGCWMTTDQVAELEKLVRESNPFVPGVSIKRADLIAMLGEIKTFHALMDQSGKGLNQHAKND